MLPSPIQLSFPFIEPVGLLAVVNMQAVSYQTFVGFVRDRRPQFMFDLRPFPSFDLGQLSRRLAFRLFADANTTYRDLTGALGITGRNELATAGANFAEAILEAISETTTPARRLALLVDGSTGARWAQSHVAVALGRAAWAVQEVQNTG
jgi:hypothetical protein